LIRITVTYDKTSKLSVYLLRGVFAGCVKEKTALGDQMILIAEG
jgi:hypothetical protein